MAQHIHGSLYYKAVTFVYGLNRRRRPEVLGYLERATGPWQQCRAGIVASEKAEAPKTLVQEVASDKVGVRVFVVHSDERMSYERAEREKSQQRVREELDSLKRRVATGKLKAPEKSAPLPPQSWLAIMEGATTIGSSKRDGLVIFEHPVNFKQEQALEGKYLIQTEERNLSAVQAVEIYKELSEGGAGVLQAQGRH